MRADNFGLCNVALFVNQAGEVRDHLLKFMQPFVMRDQGDKVPYSFSHTGFQRNRVQQPQLLRLRNGWVLQNLTQLCTGLQSRHKVVKVALDRDDIELLVGNDSR